MRAFAGFRPFEIQLENRSRQRFDSIVFANISQMAKVATLSEDDGRPDDGQFEVITIKHAAKWRLLGTALRAGVRGLGPQPSVREYHFTNLVRPLIHGAAYFAELHRRVSQMRDEDLLLFADWRGDPDERLTALRLNLACEHLDREGPLDDLHDPAHMFTAFADSADSAAKLQGWDDGGCRGPRPLGRLRPVNDGKLTSFTRGWATVLDHLVYDPTEDPSRTESAAFSEPATP